MAFLFFFPKDEEVRAIGCFDFDKLARLFLEAI
jgi:hypothetical protein